MPVANKRQSVRLTPVDTTFANWDYLKAQPPACSALKASLAVFAFFILILLSYKLFVWRRRLLSDKIPARSAFPELGTHVDKPGTTGQTSGFLIEAEPRDSPTDAMSEQVTFTKEKTDAARAPKLALDPQWTTMIDNSPHAVIARPPPAPPLTPPEASAAVYTFEPRSSDQDSFIHQPNPDYLSSTSDVVVQTSSGSTSTARRRSYNKTIPIGIPAPPGSAASQTADLTLPSSSYPPTSLQLPPAPPSPGRSAADNKPRREIEVRGEIISLLDDEGAGWTRHTRVYGGGACLACAASGGTHGGGFYGANVTREEMW